MATRGQGSGWQRRRLWTMVSGLWTAGFLGLGLMPAAWGHSEEAAVSYKTYTPITVDGKLDDWVRRLERGNWSAKMEITNGEVVKWIRAVPIYVNTLSSRVESGAVTSPQDLSAVLYTLWDEQQLYIAALVTDDQVVTQHEGADMWQDDTLELWVDCRHDAVTHTLSQDDEYQLGFSPASKYRNHAIAWAWRNPDTQSVIAAMQVASVLMPNGYVLEASVPWSVLHGCHPSLGGMIGFNISLADKDEDQLWSHITWSGQLHSDPSQFGHLYFMDAPVDLFPSDVFEAPPGDSSWETILEPSKGSHR